jgi:two-component system osmolarity sensor histidine kinase EnvZ
MGGIFALANTTSGGLAAHIKLQKPKAPSAQGEAEQPKAEAAY